ncbi:AEC family transporter [Dietzia timorensis]|uniref:Putative malonate transporter n=1 Tax=Dietzia timorensis TaxID=499555 RepID=A0A173LN33_9ACTN|nr:AEC family transporter [Dietzia timorensis]ANI93048.1 Putative malonate transporter [Dietzia timorensis]
MLGVLSGFGVIAVVIAVGWICARTNVLGSDGQLVLNRMVFFVATPALLLDSLAQRDIRDVLSEIFLVSAGTAVIVALIYVALARGLLGRRGPTLVMGAMSASYVNSANLGIPIALYVLGDLAFVAPLMLFQVCLLQPVIIAIMDRLMTAEAASSEAAGGAGAPSTGGGGRSGAFAALAQSARNPLIISGLLGLVLAALPWKLPERVLEPIHLIGQASVPGALLVFGMSLYGVRVLERGISPRTDVALVTVLKMIVQPLLAWGVGLALGMEGHALFTVVVAACLPTAQNVLVVANRYGRGVLLARDSAVTTTVLALPVLIGVAAVLAG